MEYVIVLLLIYLIFKDEIREEINYYKGKRKQETIKTQEEEKKEERKEEFEKELNSIMDYSVDTAINSRKGR
jgi:hypothetical protein